jgi:FAD/FMN-containing dehydrogenase
VCLNDGGWLLLTRSSNRFLEFDPGSGILCAESGVSFGEILKVCVPHGWFLPVTPGTRFVTLGGAIANDVHGKNHHRAGTFGRHVIAFELLRSDGSRLHCSLSENPDWFRATVGGLGLTGLITWARIQLRPVPGTGILQKKWFFADLGAFFQASLLHESKHEYTVSWVDCTAGGNAMGRGIFTAGDHTAQASRAPARSTRAIRFRLPLSAVNSLTVSAFNHLYCSAGRRHVGARVVHYEPFFYPLDRIPNWNRIYGRRGFLQHQSVVPMASSEPAIREMLRSVRAARQGSFLAVLKTFGTLRSPGILSFPREGTTLALDFANRGTPTYRLLERLDRIVVDAGGAIYPAKDARMSRETFRASFPGWEEFAKYVDPAFSSSFWRRIHASAGPNGRG